MKINNKTISIIIRTGSIIATTLASFIVTPPVIDSTENDGVHWKNIFTFIAGVLSILLYDKWNKKRKLKSLGFWLIGVILILFVSYEVLYYEYSATCFEGKRCVISHANVKKEVQADLVEWNKENDPTLWLLKAYRCSSIEVWRREDLMIPYYSFIFLYFSIMIVLILLITSISDRISKTKRIRT